MSIINTVTGGGDAVEKAGVLAPLVSGTVTEITEKELDGLESIRGYAFYQCPSLEKITIPEGPTYTKGHTFTNCWSLKEASLPESLTDLGQEDFSGCSALESITFSSGVTRLPERCFNNCNQLSSINLDNVTDFGSYCLANTALAGELDFSDRDYVDISDYAFAGTELTQVNLGPCTRLNGTFSNCRELTTVVFGDVDYLYIGDNAFNYCTKLTGLVLPDIVEYLGAYAFNGCTSLTGTFIIPASVGESYASRIGDSIFGRCTGLTEIQMPDSLKHISSGAFYGCSGLASMALPSSLETIGTSATFTDCSGLEGEIDLSGVKAESSSSSYRMFEGCSKLVSVKLPQGMETISSACFQNCTALESVVFPEGVTSLGMNCFSYCTSLASITIPESVTSLANECFSYCMSLASIDIPDSVTSIGGYCFYICKSLTSIDMPEGVTSLGMNCFSYCTSLASITIPEGVTSIGGYCFLGCSKLASVTMLPTTPPTLGSNAFGGTASGLVITVPKGTLDAYKAATNWSAYADNMVEASE